MAVNKMKILFLFVVLTSCTSFEKISVVWNDNDLVFKADNFRKNTLEKGDSLRINSFGIVKLNCKKDCVYWRWHVQENNNVIKNGSFKYNDLKSIKKIESFPSKKLDDGLYEVAFGISHLSSKKELKNSYRFLTKFNFLQKNGDTIVTQD